MEELFPCLVKLLNSQSDQSPQLHRQSEIESGSNTINSHGNISDENVKSGVSVRVVKTSIKHHVQGCAGPNCNNNRHDNPGL